METLPIPEGPGRRVGLLLGLLGFAVLLLVPVDPSNPMASRLAAVALLMAVWWVSDAIPLFATSLVPLVLFPLLGIMSGGVTAPYYFNSTIVLFLGGFMIALTMERWNLHRRIALEIIHRVGGGPARIVLGFMIAAMALSMWISNTATAVMMVPIGLAMILQIEEEFGRERTHRFSVGLMIGIAYGCSMGGITTLVGTPPNLSLVRIFEILFPDEPPIAFGPWMVMSLPIGIILLVAAWALITKVFYPPPPDLTVAQDVVEAERGRLGPVSYEERWILAVFATTAFLWVFRVDLELGILSIPGWSRLLPTAQLVDDGTIAITMAAILFLIPARDRTQGARRLLERDVIPRLPWNVVLLFGGGFALAAGFQETGLAGIIGGQFRAFAELPPLVMIFLLCLVLTFLTELTSNTATAEMILPILAAVAVATGTHPLLLMIPGTISCSLAFMMPVGTAPNAIVFGSGRLSIGSMAKVGFVLNLIGVVVVTALVYWVGTAVFDITPRSP